MDEAQPVGHRVTERERLAGELGDGTRVRRVVAGERLDQRRLAGAVLTDERVDLALADLDRRVDQSPGSGKRLREALDAQRRCARARPRTASLVAESVITASSPVSSGSPRVVSSCPRDPPIAE